MSGTGKFLKSKDKNIKVVAVEPKTSPVLSQGVSGSHKIQGIGAGFVPSILNKEMIDEIITVSNENITYNKENIKRITLKAGESMSLNIALAPANATNQTIIWEPDKEGVVAFAEDGTITGLKRGFVSVFVRADGGVNKADYMEINVRA